MDLCNISIMELCNAPRLNGEYKNNTSDQLVILKNTINVHGEIRVVL